MESSERHPNATEASAALSDAEASRAELAQRIRTPSWFFTSIGVAIAAQIALTAVALSWSVSDSGIAAVSTWTLAAFGAGIAILLLVAGVQLAAFRRLNGLWLGGLLSRVVLGTGILASGAYVVALGAAIWSAIDRAVVVGRLVFDHRRRRVRARRPTLVQLLPGRARTPRARGVGGNARAGGGRGNRRSRAAADLPLMAELDPHVMAPARLKLLVTLTAVSEIEFGTVRDSLEVSDSVLSKHLASLEDVDYVKRRKGVHRGRRTTWIALTPDGRRALDAHIEALHALIDGVTTPR